jgi:F-type H+-transporting ATPase subunit delta
LNPFEYGKALFLLTEEEGLTEQIKTEAEAICRLLSDNPKYITLLDTPALSTAEKCKLLDEAFGTFHEFLLNFMKIMVSKRSVYLFPRAYDAFCDAYDIKHNILHAKAVTAIPMDEKQKTAIIKKLSSITGKNVVLESIVDPTIVGGVRLQYDGKQLDSSLKSRLDALHKSLKQTNL